MYEGVTEKKVDCTHTRRYTTDYGLIIFSFLRSRKHLRWRRRLIVATTHAENDGTGTQRTGVTEQWRNSNATDWCDGAQTTRTLKLNGWLQSKCNSLKITFFRFRFSQFKLIQASHATVLGKMTFFLPIHFCYISSTSMFFSFFFYLRNASLGLSLSTQRLQHLQKQHTTSQMFKKKVSLSTTVVENETTYNFLRYYCETVYLTHLLVAIPLSVQFKP